MRRIERLINLIAALLDSSRPLTAEEIREQIAGYDQANFDAFRRAFERDKDSLRAMGIPVETVPTDPLGDVADGYTIPKEKYYLPELDLEPDEVAALKIAADAVLGAGEQAEAGFLKLSIDAGPDAWSGPRVVWGADVAAEQPLLRPLYTAWLERAPVTFTYTTAAGERGARTVEAYGLVHRRGHWYVVGRDVERDAVRSFKLSRISGRVQQGADRYEVPDAFDAERHLAGEAWEIGEREVAATLRFEPAFRWWAEQNLGDLHIEENAAGGVDVQVPVANEDALVSWVIGFGGEVEVVAPAEMRARVVEHVAPFLEDPA